MGNLLTRGYWMQTRPGNLYLPIQKSLIVALFAMFVLYVLILIFKNRIKENRLYNRFFTQIQSFMFFNFTIGLFLLFFTYERIPVLSMRFWFIMWGLGMIYWIYYIVKIYKKIPEIREKLAKEREIKKYIP